MERVSRQQAQRISQLSNQIGERTLRTLLATGDKPILKRSRLENLERGTGKLTQTESDRLARISDNVASIKRLESKSADKREFKRNRSIRDWIVYGKERDTPYEKGTGTKAVKGLYYLGVDPTDGTYYVKIRK